MRISAIFMPFFALLAGAVGFYLRLMELMDVFDVRSGLPRRGADITFALIAFSVAVLIIILMFAVRVSAKYKAPVGFEKTFGTDPIAYPIVSSFIGIVWLVGTAMHFFNLNSSGNLPLSELLFLILSALSAIALAFFAIEMFQDPKHRITFALSIVPTLFQCFWLILLYRQNASNPVLLSYCYKSLAIIASALGFYFTSGFVYSKPAPGKAVFSYFAAIFFCFVTLADDHAIGIKLIIAALIAVNVVYSSMLIRNLRWKTA